MKTEEHISKAITEYISNSLTREHIYNILYPIDFQEDGASLVELMAFMDDTKLHKHTTHKLMQQIHVNNSDRDKQSNYIEDKISLLEKNGNVVFEFTKLLQQQPTIITIRYSQHKNGYIYNMYDLHDHKPGNALDPIDEGFCTGSAAYAVAMTIM